MILRTPRRRISPRTRHKYRTIREFFRRALCSSSQQDIKISSSIALNVTELKRKIIGLENQLEEISRHCPEMSSLDISSIKDSQCNFSDENVSRDRIKPTTEAIEKSSEPKINSDKTKAPYKKRHKNDISEWVSPPTPKEISGTKMINDNIHKVPKTKITKLYKKSTFETLNNTQSTTSLKSCTFPKMNTNEEKFPGHRHNKNNQYNQCSQYIYPPNKRKLKRSVMKCTMGNTHASLETRPIKSQKHKSNIKNVDDDFIADIIRRQYKPVKVFKNKESDASLFSVPVCRDQQCSLRENVIGETELCPCCYDRHEMWTPTRTRDVRSMGDTRMYRKLYSQQHRSNKYQYDSSDLYDLIPVKEKSSPKTSKKFIDENVASSACYKEVPPSPRTLRPRLNLKAQYQTDSDDNQNPIGQVSSKRLLKHETYAEDAQSDLTSATVMDKQKPSTSTFDLNKTRDSEPNVDKTDKALSEIKNFLQGFLQEIKKETIGQNDKVTTPLKDDENARENGGQTSTNNALKVGSVSLAHIPPFIPAPGFPNSCCYPVLPICPHNCPVQNGFIRPNQIIACANCGDIAKDAQTAQNDKTNTDELIKEIYKHVAQRSFDQNNNSEVKEDGTNKIDDSLTSKYNDKDGTPPLRCVSKSCEAIGSYNLSDGHYGGITVVSSDTVVDKLAFETTRSELESFNKEINKSNENVKTKPNKFRKVLKMFGLFKTKKQASNETNNINEYSSEQTDVPAAAAPYRQHITNYMMHSQKYCRPPPMPSRYQQPYVNPNHHPPYSQPLHQPCPPRDMYGHIPYQPEYGAVPGYHSDPRYFHDSQSSAQPSRSICECCMHQQPQVCLKEIEVRSTGTQSEKMPLFHWTKKTKPPHNVTWAYRRSSNVMSQKAQPQPQPPPKPLSPLMAKWKHLKEKAMEDLKKNPPNTLEFTRKKHKEFAEGDINVRNVVLKNLFKSRMPINPRSMLVKSLLRKEQPCFTDPQTVLNQRNMFV